MAKYGKNRGRVKILGVLLGVYFKNKNLKVLFIKACGELFGCRAYNRTAHLKERHAMMQTWADYLDGLKAGAVVLPFKKAH